MADQLIPLTEDDYAQLHALVTSTDEKQRADGQGIAKNLTPAESRAFFDYQQQANKASGAGERTRTDNSVLGVPPELAVTGAIGIGRAAAAGVGSLIRNVGIPWAKYEFTERSLRAMGVPPYLAKPIAIAAAATRFGGGASAPGEAEAAAAPEMGPARPPTFTGPNGERMALDPSVAPGVDTTRAMKAAWSKAQNAPAAASAAPGPTMSAGTAPSPQMIRNQLGIAAVRAGVKLTDPVETAATALMQKGMAAADALTQALSSGESLLTAGEDKLVAAMVRRGASDAEVQAAVKAARAFNTKFGLATPTGAETRFPKGWGGSRPLGALEP